AGLSVGCRRAGPSVARAAPAFDPPVERSSPAWERAPDPLPCTARGAGESRPLVVVSGECALRLVCAPMLRRSVTPWLAPVMRALASPAASGAVPGAAPKVVTITAPPADSISLPAVPRDYLA